MWASTDNKLWRIKYFVIFKQNIKVKAWTQHKVNLHFLNILSLNNTYTSFLSILWILTGSDLRGTIITFIWARVFSLVYLTNVIPFDGELIKSTIAPFDGELDRSTIAASPSFLLSLPLLCELPWVSFKVSMASLSRIHVAPMASLQAQTAPANCTIWIRTMKY